MLLAALRDPAAARRCLPAPRKPIKSRFSSVVISGTFSRRSASAFRLGFHQPPCHCHPAPRSPREAPQRFDYPKNSAAAAGSSRGSASPGADGSAGAAAPRKPLWGASCPAVGAGPCDGGCELGPRHTLTVPVQLPGGAAGCAGSVVRFGRWVLCPRRGPVPRPRDGVLCLSWGPASKSGVRVLWKSRSGALVPCLTHGPVSKPGFGVPCQSCGPASERGPVSGL